MSEASGTEPASTGETTAVIQPAASPAPAAGNTLREDQVAIDKAALEPFGGDTHEVVRLANQVRQAEDAMGMPFDKFMEGVLAEPDPIGPPVTEIPSETPPPETPATEVPAPFTSEQFTELSDKRDAAKAEVEATEREDADRASTEVQVKQDKDRHVVAALKVIGCVPNDKEEWPKQASKHQALFERCLQDAIGADIPGWASKDEEAIEEAMYRSFPTPSQITRATEEFKNFYADLGSTAVAKFATGQSEVPGATVGVGAGGGAPQKKLEDMTYEEQLAAISDPRDRTQPGQ